MELLDFSEALKELKLGKKIARVDWYEEEMFLTLQQGSVVKGTDMRNQNAREFYGDEEVNIAPHIDMKAADGTYVCGWLASQTDILASDWVVLE